MVQFFESFSQVFSDLSDSLSVILFLDVVSYASCILSDTRFFALVSEGSASFEKRKELFEARKEAVEAEIKSLQETLSLLEFKCWYYSKAMEDGTEEYIQAMLPDKLPNAIQKLYDASHK